MPGRTWTHGVRRRVLRERLEDVPELAEHFLREHAERRGRSIRGLSTGALRRLLRHDWPGNVRELEGAIGRAMLIETGDVLQEGSLPPLVPVRPGGPREEPAARRSARPLAEVERQALVDALETCGNNVTRAARALGIHRATLHRKLKSYGLLAGE